MTSAGRTTAQYCDFEVFEARCAASHEVVVMAAASYGRRETGRCLPPDSVIESLRHDPRYFGCSADVLRLADRKCSGRPRCDVAIPDSDFERVTPCYKDSRKYLEAKYDCVKGMQQSTIGLSSVHHHHHHHENSIRRTLQGLSGAVHNNANRNKVSL